MWTQAETESDVDVSKWMLAQRRARRKKMLIWAAVIAGTLLVTWLGIQVLFSVAGVEREHDQWLKDNGCKVVSHREGEWKYSMVWDYWEHIPGETCYRCKKIDAFCEEG